MDTWKGKCDSCGWEGEAKASSEEEAIGKLKEAHNQRQTEKSHNRCNFGPFISCAWNLDHPKHPAAIRGW